MESPTGLLVFIIYINCLPPTIIVVAYLLKARIVKPPETAVAREWL
jgi:hypothetical protein